MVERQGDHMSYEESYIELVLQFSNIHPENKKIWFFITFLQNFKFEAKTLENAEIKFIFLSSMSLLEIVQT